MACAIVYGRKTGRLLKQFADSGVLLVADTVAARIETLVAFLQSIQERPDE
jgi:hypothetical protein